MPYGKKYGGRDWVPGQSGNPKGRPPCPLKAAIKKALAEKHTIKIDGKARRLTDNEIMVEVLKQHARNGNIRAIELLWDRGFGLATQQIEFEGSVQQTGTVAVTVDKLHEIILKEKQKREQREAAKRAANGNGKKH